MSKYDKVPDGRKKEIFAINQERAENKEAADDLRALLDALPPGQVKNLLKDEICGELLRKYGITES